MEWEETIEKELSEAEMVLVGLGEEFDECKEAKDLDLIENVLVECEAAWLIPEVWNALREKAKGENADERIEMLNKLADRLKGKNCYVLCLAENREIANVPWREGRLVAPCGFGTKKQCALSCEGEEPKKLTENERDAIEQATREFLSKLYDKKASDTEANDKEDPLGKAEKKDQAQWGDLPVQVREAMEMIQQREQIRTAALEYQKKCEAILGSCPICGGQEILNVVQAPKYDQRGYLKEWTRYTKWLYGSMNRKLLILGLGTSKKHPELLQGAFQKLAELHTKAIYHQILL